MSDQISYTTNIPEYILRALGFAIGKRLTIQIGAAIARYRIKKDESNNEKFGQISPDIGSVLNDRAKESEFLELYQMKYPQDVLTKLIEYSKEE